MAHKKSKILLCAISVLLAASVSGAASVNENAPHFFYASPMFQQIVRLPEVTAHMLSGTVVNVDGSPLPNAKVEMIAMKGSPTGKALHTTATNENGQFSFSSSANNRYRLRISKDGYRMIVVVFHVSSKAMNRRVVLQLPLGG
jgi:hypothetical protein